MPHALMIFAAGFGTRMGALTQTQPKPMIPVAGKPLIDHTLEIASSAGIETVVANIHYLPEPLAEHLVPKGVKLSLEPDEILETGGGLRQALPLLGPDPVFTMNSDAVWTGANPLAELGASWNPDTMDALLLLLPPAAATGHNGSGDFMMDDHARLSRGPGYIYSGAQIIKTDTLADIPDRAFSLNLLWDRMIAANRLSGLVHDGGWCDVGHPEGIAQAEALLNTVRDV